MPTGMFDRVLDKPLIKTCPQNFNKEMYLSTNEREILKGSFSTVLAVGFLNKSACQIIRFKSLKSSTAKQ